MTPMKVAASAGDAQAMAARGRNTAAGKDGDFGAILSDVAQDGASDTVALARGDASGRIAPAAVQKPASTAGAQLDVDAMLAKLVMTAPFGSPATAAAAGTPAQASKSREAQPPTDGESSNAGQPSTPDSRAASLVASAVAATTFVARTAPSSVTNGVDVPQGGKPATGIEPGGKFAPPTPEARTLGTMTPTFASYALRPQPSRGGKTMPAIETDGKGTRASPDAQTLGTMTPTFATYTVGPQTPGGVSTSATSPGGKTTRDGSGAGTLGTMTPTFATYAVGAQTPRGGSTPAIGPDARATPDSPGAGTLGKMTPTFATYAVDPQTPRDGDAAPAVTAADKPTFAAAETVIDDTAVAREISPTQVALVAVARHLAPVQAAPAALAQVEAPPPAAADDADGAKAEAKSAPVSTPLEAASAAPDAENRRALHMEVFAAPIVGAEATEAASSPPVRQIADAVTDLAADAAPSQPSATQAAAARPSPSRSLILHLAPATLGTVTVRLHLAEGGLSVRLAVENQTTLGLISHARDALQAAIGATYKLDQLVIQGADASAVPNTGSHDATRSDGNALADQQAGGQRGNEDTSRRAARPSPREVRADGSGRADGLFV